MCAVKMKMSKITSVLLTTFLQTTILGAPLQLQPMQGLRLQQLSLLQEHQQQSLLQLLQRITQPQIPIVMQQIPLLQQLQKIAQQQIQSSGALQNPPPLLLPLQGTVQQQQLAMQEQMFAVQQFQALQRMNLIPSSMSMNTPPMLVLIPNNEADSKPIDYNVNSLKYQKPEEIGDKDSEIIDAEPNESTNSNRNPMRAFLFLPNTRSIIGDFITSIPFLPIEINVPDSISWIYNGIAGIIAGIGQNLPFRPQEQPAASETPNAGNTTVKTFWNKLKINQQMPIVVVPLGQ